MKSRNQFHISLPSAIIDAGVIQNPKNAEEILVFGGHQNTSTMTYNTSSGKYTENFVCLNQILNGDNPKDLQSVNAIAGTTNDKIILVGSAWTSLRTQQPFYAVYNVHINKFEQLNTQKSSNSNPYCIIAGDTTKMHCFLGSRICKYKNYLISTGGNLKTSRSKVFIYDISDELKPKFIFTIELNDNDSEGRYSSHGIVILEHRKHNISITVKHSPNDDIITLLLFGGSETSFIASFCEIEINLSGLKQIEYSRRLIDNSDDRDEETEVGKNDNCNRFFKIDYNPAKRWNLNELKQQWNKLCVKRAHCSEFSYYGYFTYQWYDERYLIILGGNATYNLFDLISVYDFKKKLWFLGCKKYKLPKPMLGLRSVIVKENGWNGNYKTMKTNSVSEKNNKKNKKNGNSNENNDENKNDFVNVGNCKNKNNYLRNRSQNVVLHVMGGCDKWGYDGSTFHWKVQLRNNIDWNIERLIWIAHLKNDDNTQRCKLTLLSKDVILHVLLFLQQRFVLLDDY